MVGLAPQLRPSPAESGRDAAAGPVPAERSATAPASGSVGARRSTHRSGWAIRLLALGALLVTGSPLRAVAAAPAPAGVLRSRHLEFRLAASGAYEIRDRRGGVTWRSHPDRERFGTVTVGTEAGRSTVDLARPQVTQTGSLLRARFQPLPGPSAAALVVTVQVVGGGDTLEFSYQADPALKVESVRLLDEALWVSARDVGYVLMPVREGLLIPADSGLAFTQGFDTYAYEGCHMAMFGLSQRGAQALVTWTDPYVLVELRSTLASANKSIGAQALFPSLTLRQSARSFRVRFLGPGDHTVLAKAYRPVARERGWLVPWSEKLQAHPERARLFGAVNFKLWSLLDRTMDEASAREERAQVNWTFAEAAQVAEHLKSDLELERVLFLMGGWIHRGYDNQHPDILPAAPECGGDAALADCARRVRQLGYVFGLHDNYQDMYRDAPSWNEDYLTRNPDGSLATGGRWAGGRAYLTCSQKAIELARREQNLPAVQRLTGADAYFIDTTYAAGLMECADPRHPLRRGDDMRWKQALSDYARGRFGIFGSECGREWALPHSDFFEGLTGVSGGYYHNADLLKQTGGLVVPLFELVYRDGIALYGKYGYDVEQAADYVLHHLVIGRPLHYHDVPAHLYWRNWSPPVDELPIRPCRPELEQTGPREIGLSYQWIVRAAPKEDWRVFVHFTDGEGTIYQQNDHEPAVPTSQWRPGRLESARFAITLSDRLRGSLQVRVGLWDPASGRRARLDGVHDGEQRYVVGRLRMGDDRIELLPPANGGAFAASGVFTRAEGGWAAGRHPLDRFLKNTYEILSPLNAITAQMEMTRHEFLTTDRRVQRSVFGAGRNAVQVTVNFGDAEFAARSSLGGEVRLPRHGFLVESPAFVAFHARSWNGLSYDAPVLFTLQSQGGQTLAKARRVRVFHGFGDSRLGWRNVIQTIEKERVLANVTP